MGKVSRGFTLVEVLVTTAVLAIFLLATAMIVQVGMQALGEARLRGEATRIAQEKLELVRNLSYYDVGTIGGIPAGPLLPSETVRVHDTNFEVTTVVLYVDDPFDGLAPVDLIPTDYKRVKVSVGWSGLFASKTPIVLMTDISASGQETEDDVGTLLLRVFNALGQPLESASIRIQSLGLEIEIDMTVLTDVDGSVIIPGAPVCNNCYRISASKVGYTEDRTYSFTEVDNPIKPDVSVIRGLVSEASFAIDVPSTLVVKATRNKAASYQPFVGAQFTLRGTKIIGRTSQGESVYKVSRTITTSTGGLTTVSNLEWDQYMVETPSTSTVDIAGTWPFLPISLLPGNNQQVTVIIQAVSEHSLLVQVLNNSMQPVDQFVTTLINQQSIATQSSGTANQGDWSQAYFASLTSDLHDVIIESPGYATESAIIDISGDVRDLFILDLEDL